MRALWDKDARLAWRAPAARARLLTALGAAVVSVALWQAPASLAAVRAFTFVVALIAAAAFGEWLITLGGHDPFAVARALPVGVGAWWATRAATAAAITLALVGAHALVASGPAGALHLSLFWLAIFSFTTMLLAIHLQLTLFPHADHAARIYALVLALAVVCSLMIPLLGWVVLFAATLHSGRRLARWWRLEERA